MNTLRVPEHLMYLVDETEDGCVLRRPLTAREAKYKLTETRYVFAGVPPLPRVELCVPSDISAQRSSQSG